MFEKNVKEESIDRVVELTARKQEAADCPATGRTRAILRGNTVDK